jgi:hypothetical protein
MTPQEKAKKLYDKYVPFVQRWDDFNAISIKKENAKQCALLALDEIIPIVEGYEDSLSLSQQSDALEWWQEVKQEIEKL